MTEFEKYVANFLLRRLISNGNISALERIASKFSEAAKFLRDGGV